MNRIKRIRDRKKLLTTTCLYPKINLEKYKTDQSIVNTNYNFNLLENPAPYNFITSNFIQKVFSIPLNYDGKTFTIETEKKTNLNIELIEIDKTTSPLVANGTYTGSSQSTKGYSILTVSVFANVNGTIYVEQSADGTNFDVVDNWNVTGGNGFGIETVVVCPYARVRYVNGATAQGTFRLYFYKKTL